MELLFLILKFYSIIFMGTVVGIGVAGITSGELTGDLKYKLIALSLFIPVLITLILA